MLADEIEAAQRLVKTDAYQMSIGEVVNLYKDGDLLINPDFQRLFRWDIDQKAKLIESLLLGIPLPSIFVFEREDAKWELIDGLQRLSTLLEFMGELRDPETSHNKSPTYLVPTKYLPSLENTVWEKSDKIDGISADEQMPLTGPERLQIKRSRLSVEILKRPSENATKYDLFQRLNAGGIVANAQELRNCIAIMVNPKYATFISKCANSEDFLKVLKASDDQLEKQRHMEFATRFLVHTFISFDKKLDVEAFIDEGIIALATEGKTKKAAEIFEGTFKLLNSALGEESLRRVQNGKAQGRVGLAAFECIAVGIGRNYAHIKKKTNPIGYITKRISELWQRNEIESFFTPGLRGTVRIQRTIPFGEAWFGK